MRAVQKLVADHVTIVRRNITRCRCNDGVLDRNFTGEIEVRICPCAVSGLGKALVTNKAKVVRVLSINGSRAIMRACAGDRRECRSMAS